MAKKVNDLCGMLLFYGSSAEMVRVQLIGQLHQQLKRACLDEFSSLEHGGNSFGIECICTTQVAEMADSVVKDTFLWEID